MTGTFDAKRSDGITDALPGYLFEQRTQICRADVGMSCDIIPVSYTHLDVYKRQLPAPITLFSPIPPNSSRRMEVRFSVSP